MPLIKIFRGLTGNFLRIYLDASQPSVYGRFGYCCCYLWGNLEVHGAGYNIFGTPLFVRYEGGDGVGCSDLHLFADICSPDIQSSPEYARERQAVVNLVRKIGSASGNNRCSCRMRLLWHDLGCRVGHGKYYGVFGHTPDHILSNRTRSRQPHEDISTLYYRFNIALDLVRVGDLGHFFLDPVHPLFTSLVDRSCCIAQDEMFGARCHEQF